LSNKLITVNGRVLKQENLQGYSVGFNGDWTSKLHSSHMCNIATMPNCWAILTFEKWSTKVEEFTKHLINVAKELKFTLQRPKMLVLVIKIITAIYHLTQTKNMIYLIYLFYLFRVKIKNINITTYTNHLERILNEYNPSFILCIIESSRKDFYNVIKRLLCVTRAGNQFLKLKL